MGRPLRQTGAGGFLLLQHQLAARLRSQYGRFHLETEMSKSSLRAAAVWAASTGLAVASEGPEGLGEMQGVRPLLYLLGGVAALGVVIYGMVKFLGRK
jgi:hypothetical protein